MMRKNENNYRVLDTRKHLMNKAISYLAQYSTTSKKLEWVLEAFSLKKSFDLPLKLLESEIKEVVKNCQKLGYLDDEVFARKKLKKMLESGTSIKHASSKLIQFGIDLNMANNIINKMCEKDKDLELKSALALAKKKRIGPFFKKNIDKGSKSDFNKFMGVFARAGFNYELSKKIFNLENYSEVDELLSKLNEL